MAQRTLRMTLAGLLVTLALAACSAPAPAATPFQSAAPTSPAPSPTLTVEPAVDPSPTDVDSLDCGAMTAGARAANFPLLLDVAPNTAEPITPRTAAFLQAGWKRCQWEADDGTLLDVAVLLGGGPVAPDNWNDGQAMTADSSVDCFDGYVGVERRGDFVRGADWITIDYQLDDSNLEDPVGLLQHIADEAGAYLASVSRASWVASSTWALPTECEQLDPDGLVASALGGVEGPYTSDSGLDVASGYVATNSQHLLRCRWSDDDNLIGLAVEILPRGAWAQPRVLAAPDFRSRSVPMVRGSLLVRQRDEDSYSVGDVFTDDGWFELLDNYGTLSDEQLAASADALLAAISPITAQ